MRTLRAMNRGENGIVGTRKKTIETTNRIGRVSAQGVRSNRKFVNVTREAE